jgi:hypothetical protein
MLLWEVLKLLRLGGRLKRIGRKRVIGGGKLLIRI